MQRSTPDSDADRAAQIERVIGEVLQQLANGAELDDAKLVARHPKLQPEFGERLRMLRGIMAAARQAKQPPSSGDHGLAATPFDDDVQFLRAALTNYEVLERIDYGGQGVVYRAVQRSTRRTVAIKVLLDGPLATDRQRRRFVREIELTSRLKHPNIVLVYESGVLRGRVYCAMEFVEGVPLDDYALLHGLSIAARVRIFSTVVRAVSHAHQRGIIHRDLNPGNVLVDLDGVPRILDFGLAKDVWAESVGSHDVSLTVPGQVVGTLPYLSPEQVGAGDGLVDVRSDIYSLGVMLFELLAGGFPYPVDVPAAEVRANIVARDPQRLRKAIPPERLTGARSERALLGDLEAITLKALAKDKADRYQSAAALADDLERSLAGEAVEARADRRHYLLHRTFRKYRVAFAVATLLLVVVSGASVAVTMMWFQARAQRDTARAMARVALGTLDDVIRRVDEAVRPLAGGTEVRDQLLNEVVAGRFAALRPLLESDAEMDDLRAAVYEKQGDIAVTRGDYVEAANDYQAFLDLASRETPAASSAGKRLQSIARAHRKLANVSDAGDEHFQQAVQLAAVLLDQHPDDDAAKMDLCVARTEYSGYLYLHARYEAAAAQIDAALAIAESAVASDANDDHWRELLARAYDWDGDIRIALGDGERSVRALTTALSLCRALSAARPADTDRRHRVLMACAKLGTVLRDNGQKDESEALLEEAVSIGEYLTGVDPTVAGWKGNLASAHERLARVRLEAGDLEQGRAHSDAALRLRQQLVEQYPTSTEWRAGLGLTYTVHGGMLLRNHEPEAAYEDFDVALAIREQLNADAPDDLIQKRNLGISHAWLARCCGQLGCDEEAVEHYQYAHDIAAALLAAQPSVTECALDVAYSKGNLAAAYMRFDSVQDLQKAQDLLLECVNSLEYLRSTGALAARSGQYAAWMDAFCGNLAVVDARYEKAAHGDDESAAQSRAPKSGPAD